MRSLSQVVWGAVICCSVLGSARADTGAQVYAAMGIKPQDILSSSVLTSRVMTGDAKQVVAVVTYFTGKKGEDNAVNVRLEVYAQRGEKLESLYSRDFGKENGGYVAQGDLELVDLDGDTINEIIVTWDNFREPLIQERLCEVIFRRPDRFETVWTGPVKYDATRAARKVPAERLDRFEREVDIAETLKTQGVTLFMNKTMIAVAGERLPEPKVVRETYPMNEVTR